MENLPRCKYFYSTLKDPQEERLREISYSQGINSRPQSIALIVPPSPQIPTPGREFLISGPFEGFTYIATLIKKMGYKLTVVDCRLKENIDQTVLESVGEADAVGIAAFCDSFVFLQRITKLIKQSYPKKLIFLGGPLVTSLPQIILSNTSGDCAILGEGELTLIEFLDQHFSQGIEWRDIKGIAYKENGKIQINLPRSQIKNLDNLPFLDYTIWPNYESIIKNGQILISSMRGCPQECTFCFKTIPALRMKSVERFEEEVAYLKRTTKFDYTWLNDLTFNVIEERAIKISEILKKYDVKFHCFARVKKVSKVLVERLKNTGCLGIWFGIESYDQDILDRNRKNIKIEDIEKALKIAQDAGLYVRGLFIVGLYGETEESLKKMLEFIRESNFLPLVKYLVPFPGTSLYHYAIRTGKIKEPVEFLTMLSQRRVGDYDDDIVNLTDLSDDILRNYFHQIWEITKEREQLFELQGDVTKEGPADYFIKRAKRYNYSSNWVNDIALIEKIRALGAEYEGYVLDIGIGTGKIAQAFYQKVRCVIGVDICMEMARQARNCADRIVLGMAENLPFKNNIFDVCVCRQGLQFMDPDDVLPQIYRVLKPNGIIILSHLTAYNEIDKDTTFLIQRLRNPARKNFFLPEDFVSMLQENGFSNIEHFEYITRESINQWIDNGAIDEGQMEKIKEVYRKSSDDFKRIHNIQFKNGDIFDSMQMFIVKGRKKANV